jgi:hypothetical protein
VSSTDKGGKPPPWPQTSGFRPPPTAGVAFPGSMPPQRPQQACSCRTRFILFGHISGVSHRKPGFPEFRFAPFVAPWRNERGPSNPLRCSIPPPCGAPNDLVHCVPCMHRRGRPGARTGAAKAASHLLNLGAFLSRAPAKLKLGRISFTLRHLLALGQVASFGKQPVVDFYGPGRAALAHLTTCGCYCRAGQSLSGFGLSTTLGPCSPPNNTWPVPCSPKPV